MLNQRERRKTLVIEEHEKVEYEESTSSSESEFSEEEKGLLCLSEQEDVQSETRLVGEENKVTLTSDRVELCVDPIDSVIQSMKDFKIVKNTHSRLQKENSTLLAKRKTPRY